MARNFRELRSRMSLERQRRNADEALRSVDDRFRGVAASNVLWNTIEEAYLSAMRTYCDLPIVPVAPRNDNVSKELVDLARAGDEAGFRALAACVGPPDGVDKCWAGCRARLGLPVGSDRELGDASTWTWRGANIYYILDEHGEPRPAELMEWARWFETMDHRRLALTACGEAEVSTVFLGTDHGFGDGAPVLWETMVFGGPLGGEQERYTTRAEALAGHERMVEKVTAAGRATD